MAPKSILSRLVLFAVLSVLLATAPSARADDVYIWAEESVGSVTFYFEGSIDLTGFPSSMAGTAAAMIAPMTGEFVTGSTSSVPVDDYDGVFFGGPPPSFGAGGGTFADYVTGDLFGIAFPNLKLPPGYVSGTPLSGTMSFYGTTFVMLGVDTTPKSFSTTVGSNTIHLFTRPPAPADNSALKTSLKKKIKKLGKKAKAAKKKGQTAKAKKLSKKLKKLKAKLRALG